MCIVGLPKLGWAFCDVIASIEVVVVVFLITSWEILHTYIKPYPVRDVCVWYLVICNCAHSLPMERNSDYIIQNPISSK